MDQSKMEDFVANAALLAAHLSQQCDKAVAMQQATAEELKRAADTIRQNVADGQATLSRHAASAVRDALAQEMPVATRSLEEATRHLKQMVELWRMEQASAGQRVRVAGWKSIASLAAAALLTVVATGYVAWHNTRRAERAHVEAEVLEALQKVTITSCGGTPCIKLEDGLPRWSKNDEYVLVDTAAPREASAR